MLGTKRILVLGVSPFEDLPGYQLLALLKDIPDYRVVALDDSEAAQKILTHAGATVHLAPHPGRDEKGFLEVVELICRKERIDLILPGTDAHLFALARAHAAGHWFASLCKSGVWLASNGIGDKQDLQNWLSSYIPVPKRWPIKSQADLDGSHIVYPIMVKGTRKGGTKCETKEEAVAALAATLKNPANLGSGGGAYLEEHVDGEEHCYLFVKGCGGSLAGVGIRKLATTQTGTTLAASIDYQVPPDSQFGELADQLGPGMVVEVEWRSAGATAVAFEANVRFPSWIGALGETGQELLKFGMLALLGEASSIDAIKLPQRDAIIYRLPQSGFLAPHEAFEQGRSRRQTLLWKGSAPHQFLIK